MESKLPVLGAWTILSLLMVTALRNACHLRKRTKVVVCKMVWAVAMESRVT
uniref:Uncharacterized protein n=1 Tax=Anguilla anguilla TaxID=7936 RepID=A0A0E9SSA3_ANGAN